MSEKTQNPPGSTIGEHRALEALIDDILEGTFPASDPPAWGSAAARVEHMKGDN